MLPQPHGSASVGLRMLYGNLCNQEPKSLPFNVFHQAFGHNDSKTKCPVVGGAGSLEWTFPGALRKVCAL